MQWDKKPWNLTKSSSRQSGRWNDVLRNIFAFLSSSRLFVILCIQPINYVFKSPSASGTKRSIRITTHLINANQGCFTKKRTTYITPSNTHKIYNNANTILLYVCIEFICVSKRIVSPFPWMLLFFFIEMKQLYFRKLVLNLSFIFPKPFYM